MPWTPLQKLSITSGAALLLIGAGGVVAYVYASTLVQANRAVARTNTNIANAYRIAASTQDAERLAKAYVVRPDTARRQDLDRAQSEVEDAVDALRSATEDNPRQRANLDRAIPFVARGFSEFRRMLAARDHFGPDSARRFLLADAGDHAHDSLMVLASGMREEELHVLAQRTRSQAAAGDSAISVILLGTVLTFLLAGLALQPMRPDVHARLSRTLAFETIAEPTVRAPASGTNAAAALQQAIAAFDAPRDPAAAARTLVSVAHQGLKAEVAGVVVADGAGGFSLLAASSPEFRSVIGGLADAVAEVLRLNAVIAVPTRAERERRWGTLAVLDGLGARGALLAAPLRREGAASGVLLLACAEDRVFDAAEQSFALALGQLGGPAVASSPLT